jgi:outer membrane protein OmpA-like peptidoglycan-associated protein
MAKGKWTRATEEFRAAAAALERGRADRATEQGAEATATFRAAELEAIKDAILTDVRALLEQAERDKVDKHAPQTLAAAQASLSEAETALTEDRYDTDRPRLIARQAREEASHALFLTAIIKAIEDGDLELEQALMDGEKPVLRIADALDITPDLSNGVASTTDAILAEVKRARKREADMTLAIDERDERISTLEAALGGASQEVMALNSLLAEQEFRRTQAEEVEKLFAEDEAEVLRSGNSVVIRLIGLRFPSGSSDLRPEHEALLAKVQKAMQIFSDATFSVEGHTDSFGSDTTNFDLSQRRAEAVRSFLLQSTGLPAYRMTATGYGESRPIANNETSEGRARNRRIDFVMVRS